VAVQVGENFGYIDKKGRLLLKPKYEKAY